MSAPFGALFLLGGGRYTIQIMRGSYANNFVDYYALLEVRTDASPTDIRASFMRIAKQQHPDAGGSLAAMQLLNKAYATLKEPITRRAYDTIHSFETGTSAVQYRDASPGGDEDFTSGMSDEEIDSFIDDIFAEYATASNPGLSRRAKAPSFRFLRKKKGDEL